ncbi:MAG: hypothetical protein KKG59_04005 [Nanoarchaeota archaeon]|nr:hypothetical protein [Nanoarchaeota archaeon]
MGEETGGYDTVSGGASEDPRAERQSELEEVMSTFKFTPESVDMIDPGLAQAMAYCCFLGYKDRVYMLASDSVMDHSLQLCRMSLPNFPDVLVSVDIEKKFATFGGGLQSPEHSKSYQRPELKPLIEYLDAAGYTTNIPTAEQQADYDALREKLTGKPSPDSTASND